MNPCQPSPCGPNAQCQIAGDSPSCSCLPEYKGSPPNCRPECVSNSECASHLACINQKCIDPCPGLCGANADCRVVSHTPTCVCAIGYTGDPFTSCALQQCKNVFVTTLLFHVYFLTSFILMNDTFFHFQIFVNMNISVLCRDTSH